MSEAEAKEKFLLTIRAFHLLKSKEWKREDGEVKIKGEIFLDKDSCELILDIDKYSHALSDSFEVDGEKLAISESTLEKHNHEKVKIELVLGRSERAFFAENLEDMLNKQKFRVSHPDWFYIANEDFLYTGDEKPKAPMIKWYLSSIKLINLLKDICDHKDEKGGFEELELIFLQNEKLELPIKYDFSALTELKSFNKLQEKLSSNIHKDQIKSIFKTTLLDSLKGTKKDERFTWFINHFEEIYKTFENNVHLYISEFSFEKIREEIELYTREYIVKLNQTFAEIQNRILTIPLALIFVAGQTKETETVSPNNIIILLGAGIFSVLMFFLICNQKHTLEAIKKEIDAQKNNFEKKYTEMSKEFTENFRALNKRYRTQVFLLCFLSILVLVFFSASLFAFMYSTMSLKPELLSWLPL